MERTGFEHDLSHAGISGQPITRRVMLKAVVAATAGLGYASITAFGQEVNQRGQGEQSHFWQPATFSIEGDADPLDQLAQIRLGNQALSLKFGPTGPRWRQQQIDQLNSNPNFQSSVGQCFSTSIAMGDCPVISGPITIDGVDFSWKQRMIYAPLYYSGSRVEAGWGERPESRSPYSKNVDERGPITASGFELIQAIHFENKVLGTRKYLVVETSGVRGKPGEQWWVFLRAFNGNDLITTDIMGEGGLTLNRQIRIDFKRFHYSRATRIALVNTLEPHPGMESIFYETVDREPTAEILNIT